MLGVGELRQKRLAALEAIRLNHEAFGREIEGEFADSGSRRFGKAIRQAQDAGEKKRGLAQSRRECAEFLVLELRQRLAMVARHQSSQFEILWLPADGERKLANHAVRSLVITLGVFGAADFLQESSGMEDRERTPGRQDIGQAVSGEGI